MEGGAFLGCTNLKEVHISDMYSWCKIEFCDLDSNPISCGYFGDQKRLLYLNGSLVTNLTIPKGVTAIGDYALYGYSELKSVQIPDSVTSIGYAAFRQCAKLESLMIPNSVTKIDDYAFSYCDALSSLSLGEKVSYIGSAAFACNNLTELSIPNSSVGNA